MALVDNESAGAFFLVPACQKIKKEEVHFGTIQRIKEIAGLLTMPKILFCVFWCVSYT